MKKTYLLALTVCLFVSNTLLAQQTIDFATGYTDAVSLGTSFTESGTTPDIMFTISTAGGSPDITYFDATTSSFANLITVTGDAGATDELIIETTDASLINFIGFDVEFSSGATLTLEGFDGALASTGVGTAIAITTDPQTIDVSANANFQGVRRVVITTSKVGGFADDFDNFIFAVSPQITVPGAQSTNSSTNVTFSGTVSIADVDDDDQSVTVAVANVGSFSTSTGTVTATQSGSAVVMNSGSDNMTISGTLTDVNNTLNSLQYVPGGVAGQHQITVSTDDGNSGTDSETINVDVTGTYTLTEHDLTSADNSGAPVAGSLRAAMLDANAVTGADIIDASGLGTTRVITLVDNLPTISDELTINGPGANDLTIDGVDTYSIFDISSGNFTLTDITIEDGLAAGSGGAIHRQASGDVTVNGVHFSSNTTGGVGSGGAIGGSILNLTISQSLFSGNNAANGSGGAIQNGVGSSVINIENTTFHGNSASSGSGGAILYSSSGGTMNLDHVTITSNTASATGDDGIRLQLATITLNHSIIYGNGTEDVNVFSGTFDAEGTANIIGTSSGTISNNTAVSTSDPGFGALADNGGTTNTVSIGANARHAAIGSTEADDQTGTSTRPAGAGGNDLGALEEANAAPTGADFSVAAGVDGVGVITTADLGYTDGDSDPLVSVDITSLPVDVNVVLFLDANDNGVNDTEEVTAGDDISLADLDLNRLKYEAASTTGNTTFTFTVFDGEDPDAVANTGTLYSVENALDFDGTNDFVEMAAGSWDNTIGGLSQFTIEFWATNSGVTGAILGQSVNNSEYLSINSSGFISLSGDNIILSNAVFPTDGSWNHVAIVVGSSLAENAIYLNGESVTLAQNFINSMSSIPAAALRIGERNDANPLPYSGEIDELRIWNDVRTPAEIRSSAAAVIANPSGDASLIAYYDFNSGVPSGANASTLTLTDRSASGLDGTLEDGSGDAGASGFLLSGANSNWVSSDAFISTAATTPNITVFQGSTEFVSGGAAYDYGSRTTGSDTDVVFDIVNKGLAAGSLNPDPSFSTGTHYSFQTPYSTPTAISAGATQTLTVRFSPSVGGTLIDQVSIPSDDPSSPFQLNVTGEGQVVPTYTATWLDDGDGDIDQVRLDFNTSVSVTDNTTGDAFDAFSISGFTIDNVNGFLATDDFGTITGTSILLDISGVTGTASPTATIQYNDGSDEDITAVAGGLELTTNQAPTGFVDGAAPVFLSVETQDDGNGQIDVLSLTFSENIDQSDIDADENATTGETDDFTVSGGYTIAGVDTDTGSDSDVIEITLTESGSPDTGVTPDITIVGGTISDVSENNTIATLGATTATDAAPPVLVSSETQDDGNGQIDAIVLTFSETIDQVDIDADENATTGETDDFTVSGGYTIAGVDTDTGSDSDVIEIALTESGSPDTGVAPDITIVGGTISDANDVGFIGALGATTVSDGAAPVFLSVETQDDGNGQIDVLSLTFSENIDQSDIDADENATTGETDDFTVSGGYTIAGVDTDTGSDSDVIEITLTESGSPDTGVTPDITIVGGTISDVSENNTIATLGATTATDAAPPVLVSSETQDDGNGQIDAIVLTFSETIDQVDIDADENATTGETDDFTVSGGYTIAGVDTDTGSDSDVIEITLTESGSPDTGVTPDITIVGGTISDANDVGFIGALGATTVSDGAAPVFLSVETQDDGNGQIDVLSLTFSENIDQSDIDADENATTGETDDFTVSGGYTIAGVDTDTGSDSDVIEITLTESGSPDTGVTPDITIVGGTISDVSENNTIATLGATTATDAAPPVLVSSETQDDGNGQIDAIVLTFSETIDQVDIDADENATTGETDDFTVSGGYTIAGVDTDTGSDSDVIEITLTESGSPDTGVTPDITIVGGTISDANDLGFIGALGATTVSDGAAPVIISQMLDGSNNFLEVTFSEGLYTSGGGALSVGGAEFTLTFNQNTGDATAVSIDQLTQNDDLTTTAAGDDVIRFQLSTTGIPDGNETIQLFAAASSVFDNASPRNEMAGGATLGALNLNLISAADIPQFVSVLPAPDNSYFVLVLSVASDDFSSTSSESEIEIKTTNESDTEPEFRTRNFTTNGGASMGNIAFQGMTAADGSAQTSGTTWRFSAGTITGTPRGVETFEIFPKDGSEVYNTATGTAMPSTAEITALLADEFQNDFDNATATAFDVDGNGNIDEVEIVMPDGIDDATIVETDFAFNSIVADASSFDTGTTPNDNTFRITFSNYNGGTAIVGTLAFTPGNLRDDAAFSVYDDGSSPQGNLFVSTGTITPTDGAGPVIQSAITADNDLDGEIDEITVTFSEAFSNISIDASDFSISDGFGTPSGIAVSSPDITLTLTESGSFDTNVVPDVEVVVGGAGMLEDLSSGTAPNPAQTFTNTDDGAAPYSTVDLQNTSNGNPTTDTSPEITGTIDDPSASIIVNVDGNVLFANNNDPAVGQWTLPDNSFVFSGIGDFPVVLTTIDPSGNVGTDVTPPNEITVQGGATITGPTIGPLCEADGFVAMGTISIVETGNGDFGSAGTETIVLTLPAGFEFDNSITPTITVNNTPADITVTSTYIGSGSLQLNVTQSGTANIDDVDIDGLQVRVVTGGSSGALVRAGGTASLLTTDTDYATLSSNPDPSDLTDLVETSDLLTPITSFTTRFLPRVTINFDVDPGFIDGEDFEFSGGATGTMVSGTLLATSFDMYLTSGTVSTSESVTGVTSALGATTTSSAVGVSDILLPFELQASPTVTSNWYIDGTVDLTPDLTTATNDNSALTITSPGLYTYAITDDNGTCESDPLIFNILVYDDVHPDNNESTFQDKTFTVTDDRDTIFISNPTNHTVSVTGNGISVVGGGADPLLAIFDPAIAGDDSGTNPLDHTITYTITNDNTLESTSITVTFTVEPETAIFTAAPEEYCVDGATVLTLNTTGFNAASTTTFPYINRIGINGLRYGGGETLGGAQLESGSEGPASNQYDFDPQDPIIGFAIPNGDFENVRLVREIFDDAGVRRIDAENFYIIYGDPAVSLTNVNSAYCEDDASFTITRTTSFVSSIDDSNPFDPIPTYGGVTDQAITNGYMLYRSSDGGATYPTLYADFTAGTPVNTFDPTDPNQNMVDDNDDTGFFRIIYTTEALTPSSCEGTVEVDVIVNPDTPTPVLNDATLDGGGSLLTTINYTTGPTFSIGETIVGVTSGAKGVIDTDDGSNILVTQLSGAFTGGEAFYGETSGASSAINTLGSQSILITNGAPDAGVEADEYLLEYCVGEIVANFTTSDGNTVRWYDDNFNQITSGVSVTPDQVGLSIDGSSAFNAEQTVVFYFTSTDATGCESDFRLVRVNTFDTPAEPTPLTTTFGFPTAVQSGTTYNLDYCIPQGSSVTPANVDLASITAGSESYNINTYYQGIFSSQIGYMTITGASGSFVVGDTLVGATSGVQAYIQYRNGSELYLRDVTGTFINETVNAQGTGASATVASYTLERNVFSNSIDVPPLEQVGFLYAGGAVFTPFNAGETVTGGTSGATAIVYRHFPNNVSPQYIFVRFTSGTQFELGENISGSGGSSFSLSQVDNSYSPNYQFVVTKSENINEDSNFDGCEGPSISVYNIGRVAPTDPTVADLQAGVTEFHVSEGESLADITHTNIGMDGYFWYENSNLTGDIGTDSIPSGSSMTETILGTVGFDPSAVSDVTPPLNNDVYTYYFSRTDQSIDSRDFLGCESDATIPVTITVHAIQPQPEIASNNAASSINTTPFTDLNASVITDPDVDYYYSICTDRLEAANLLVATETTYPGSSRTFRWYDYDITGMGTRGTEFTTDGSGTASLAELQLTSLTGISTSTSRYFEVVQVTDDDVYAGVESNSTLVRVQVSPQDALEFRDNTGALIPDEYCRDDATGNVVVDLFADGVSAGSANVDYEIDSYLQSNYDLSLIRTATIGHDVSAAYTVGETVTGGTSGATAEVVTDDGSTMTVTNMIGTFQVAETLTGGTSGIITNTTTFANTTPGPDVDGSITAGNPTLDIDGLHDAVPGALDVGGEATVHVITMTYLDPTTVCEGSATKILTINPDPEITFFVNGIDIAAFVAGNEQFCYEDGSITLQGALADGTPLTSGSFESSELLTLTTTNGASFFNTINEHNAFHSVTGTDGKFLNQSNIDITYSYTDGNGCDNTITTTLFVNPEPEVLEVTGLPATDLAASRSSNLIRITNFCSETTDVDLEIQFVEPVEDPMNPGIEPTGEEDDYTGYTFDWTINGNDFNVSNDNTINYTLGTGETNIVMTVVVTDLNNCSETFSETHTLQSLPVLNITGVDDIAEDTDADEGTFCVDGSNPTLGLTDATLDGTGTANTVNVADIVSWTVNSYNQADGEASAVTIASGSASLPTVDLADWHTDATLTTPGTLVGGNPTNHMITIVYQDPSREYQGIATMCTSTITETITINPDPDISFEVAGNDIAAFGVGDDEFCYEDGNIVLQGTLADGTPLTSGTFTSSETGVITTTNGVAVFNAQDQHNAFHGVTGTDGEFLIQSSITITYDYTDANGCDNSVNTTLFVNPEPEIIEVTGLPTSDLAQSNTSNNIRITNFCEGSTAVTAEVEFIEPVEDPAFPGIEPTGQEDDYSLYTFAWTIGGSTVTDLNTDGLPNTIEFVPPSSTLNFSVTVTDLNGCSETYAETHQLQNLPDLDITGIDNNDAFCVDDANPVIGLEDFETDGDGDTSDDNGTFTTADVTGWTVNSYNEADGVGSAVTIASGSGNLPSVDLIGWHTDATLTTPGTLVGGNATYHIISITYEDKDRDYQGVATECSNTVEETIIINPDPDISFEVAGNNIASFITGQDQFCYEDSDNTTITLQGILADGTPLTSGTFSSNVTGVISTTNGVAVFNTSDEHNAFHGVTGTDGKFLNQSTIIITYDYTDGNGCDNAVSTTLFVNPEPEIIEVTGLPTSDLAESNTTNNIRITSFCEGSTAVTAEVQFIEPVPDPSTPLVEPTTEEDDYSSYTFAWTIGGSTVTDLNNDGLANTIEFVPPSSNLNISVTVTDLNGCEETFAETHVLQSLPDLDITGVFDNESFCVDGTDPTIGLSDAQVDGDGDTSDDNGTFSIANITSWTVDSYNELDGAGAAVTIESGSGSLPVADLIDWHTNALLTTPGSLVGGNATYHTITIVYQDTDREYQGVATSCSNTVVETIIINPEPSVSFTVAGTDISSFGVGDDQFCYDEGIIKLSGSPSGGTFTSSVLGVLSANAEGGADFNTINEHNAFHGVTGANGKFLNQSSIVITYDFTDGNGCDNSISTTLFVDPEPQIIEVTGLPATDLAASRASNNIRLTNFCDGVVSIDAEVQFVEPIANTDPSVEEDDYTGYEFIWTINGNESIINDDNTINYTLSPEEVSLVINLSVSDGNGCVEIFNETHQLQAAPILNITGIDDIDNDTATDPTSFCVDDGNPDLDLTDATTNGVGATNDVDVLDVVSWTVDSYNEGDGVAAAVTIASGVNSLPMVDLDAWHTDPTLATPGSLIGGLPTYHRITVVYQDPSRSYQGVTTECTSTISETISVTPLPSLSIAVNDINADNQEVCHDDNSIRIAGISAETGEDLDNGNIFIDGEQVSSNGVVLINGDASQFNRTSPFDAQTDHIILYEFTDGNGCVNSVSRTIFVNPRPEFVDNEIKTASTCATSNVELFVDMTDGVENYQFQWTVNGVIVDGVDLDDQDGDIDDESLSFDLGGQLSANFGVTATYVGTDFTTNCQASILNQTINVGQEPIPAVSWVGLTAGSPDGTEFVITEDNAVLPDDDVIGVRFLIDGTEFINLSKSANDPSFFPIEQTYFGFTNPGTYQVELIMETVANCNTSVVRDINILPHYTSYNAANSYVEPFETADAFDLTATQGGWYVETRSLDGKDESLGTTWTRGTAIPGSPIAANGTAAVFTNYQPGEVSFIYSPSFDLSGFEAPTISFLRYEDFATFRDGVVFQVSFDDGRNWENVGSYDFTLESIGLASTPGWYNREAITSNPGADAIAAEFADNGQGFGWAFQSDWQEAISPIGVDPAQDDYVRFRFALAAQPDEKDGATGFGFDLVEIYDRDQVVLVELFSSTLDANSNTFNTSVSNDPDFSGTDLLIINYFTDIANSGTDFDELNQRNTSDPGAKSSFYGISDVPSIAVGGDASFANISDPETFTELEAKLANSKLNDPGFDIAMTAEVNADNELVVNADFTSRSTYGPLAEIGLFVAVLEPSVTIGLNTYDNVLRKLLPNGAGQYETGPIIPNDVRSIQDMTWKISNLSEANSFPNSTELLVVAFAQDLNTKQVYQAASVPLSFTLTEEPLGLGDDLSDFELYPNPANKQFTVEFPEMIGEDAEWVLYDQAGRAVKQGILSKGTKTMTVQTAEIPSGLYFIHLYGEDRKQESRRVIVVH